MSKRTQTEISNKSRKKKIFGKKDAQIKEKDDNSPFNQKIITNHKIIPELRQSFENFCKLNNYKLFPNPNNINHNNAYVGITRYYYILDNKNLTFAESTNLLNFFNDFPCGHEQPKEIYNGRELQNTIRQEYSWRTITFDFDVINQSFIITCLTC